MMGSREPQKRLWSYRVNLDKRVRPAWKKVDNLNLLPLGLIIVFGNFASTLPQIQGLGKLPLLWTENRDRPRQLDYH